MTDSDSSASRIRLRACWSLSHCVRDSILPRSKQAIIMLNVCLEMYGSSYGCEPALANYPPGSNSAYQQQASDAASDATASLLSQGVPTASSGSQQPPSDINARVAARFRVRMLPYLLSRTN